MQNEKNFSSTFVGRNGLAVVFAGVLAALYFGFTALSSFLLFIWLVFFISNRWGKYSLKNVNIDIQTDDVYVFPNQKVNLEYKICNDKFLPLIWLEIIQPYTSRLEPDSSLKAVIYTDVSNAQSFPAFSRKFAWIMWHQNINISSQFTAKKRGAYSFNSIRIISGDGFGLSITNKDIKLDDNLDIIVYPQPVKVDTSVFLRSVFDNSTGSKGLYEDVTLLKSNRAYINGDNVKKINWRMLARKNELQVNVYETIMPKSVFFIIDLGSYGDISQDDSEFENMLSTIASTVMALDLTGMLCGIAIPKTKNRDSVVILPSSPMADKTYVLREISCIDYTNGETFFDKDEILFNKDILGQVYIFCKEQKSCTCKELIENMEESSTTIVTEKSESGIYSNKTIPITSIRMEVEK